MEQTVQKQNQGREIRTIINKFDLILLVRDETMLSALFIFLGHPMSPYKTNNNNMTMGVCDCV